MREITPEPPIVDLMELVGLFYEDPSQLGEFSACKSAGEVPEPQRGLLNHEAHMTVTVEAFHRCAVDVQVARTQYGTADKLAGFGGTVGDGRWYAREITLHRQSDGQPVQYGIVRLNIDLLAPKVWQEIESQETPLGRVLIQNDVLREVELCGLWRVQAGDALSNLLNMPAGAVTYGRTARIFCDFLPAIELIEIVSA